MIKEFKSVFVYTFPKNFSALTVCREKIIINPDTLHHFTNHYVKRSFLFTPAPMGHFYESAIFLTVKCGEQRQLIFAGFIMERESDIGCSHYLNFSDSHSCDFRGHYFHLIHLDYQDYFLPPEDFRDFFRSLLCQNNSRLK